MKKKPKICIIVVLLIAVTGAWFLVVKHMEYKRAVNGNAAVQGTYEAEMASSIEMAYLSIDENEKKYVLATAGNDVIQSGKLSKNVEGYYKLFQGDTEIVYGMIIPSYKKVYFVDTEMNMTQYFYKGKFLRRPQ